MDHPVHPFTLHPLLNLVVKITRPGVRRCVLRAKFASDFHCGIGDVTLNTSCVLLLWNRDCKTLFCPFHLEDKEYLSRGYRNTHNSSSHSTTPI